MGKPRNPMARDARTARKFAFAGFAFLAQAAWGVYANRQSGTLIAWQTGLLHGLLCFGLTLASALWMDFLYGLCESVCFKIALPIVGATLVMLTVSLGAHYWNGTPDIIRTIAPLVLLGLPYYILYTYLLWKADRKDDGSALPGGSP